MGVIYAFIYYIYVLCPRISTNPARIISWFFLFSASSIAFAFNLQKIIIPTTINSIPKYCKTNKVPKNAKLKSKTINNDVMPEKRGLQISTFWQIGLLDYTRIYTVIIYIGETYHREKS